MGMITSVKEMLGLASKKEYPTPAEIRKEQMKLNILEEKHIQDIRRYKRQWKKLYTEGFDKDIYEKKALARKMDRIETLIAKSDIELSKIDIALKTLQKIESVLDKGQQIFKGGLWDRIQNTISFNELAEKIAEEKSSEREILSQMAEIANISEASVLDAINQIEETDLEALWPSIPRGEEELEDVLKKNVAAKVKSREISAT